MSKDIKYTDAINGVFHKDAFDETKMHNGRLYLGLLIFLGFVLFIVGAIIGHYYDGKKGTSYGLFVGGFIGLVIGFLIYIFVGAIIYQKYYNKNVNSSSA